MSDVDVQQRLRAGCAGTVVQGRAGEARGGAKPLLQRLGPRQRDPRVVQGERDLLSKLLDSDGASPPLEGAVDAPSERGQRENPPADLF